MATIFTHPVVPLAIRAVAGRDRVSDRLLFWGAVAAILPDADVIAFGLGIPYADPFGHRGFTHSILFSLLLAGLASLAPGFFRAARPWIFVVIFISTLSHALLDALTNGGLGVALMWPLDNTRYFAPWQPIEVSPIGVRGFLSERGLAVIWSELELVWLPFLTLLGLIRIVRACRG